MAGDAAGPAAGAAPGGHLPAPGCSDSLIVRQAAEEYPRETAATWSEVERHIELQRRQTLAHEQARAAARKRGEGRQEARTRALEVPR